ncbi:hybrid sensor histidine kinase/response regulator [Sandarakinorhabdus oryzae]|uniref:hybrid sensor histidine kinase/response regulator n=1 Tax=Sandarakinorhabdus oryzae TaxID=2675220 RepID=UPI0012E2CCF8|nr:response regulator [Sandarakinorhabdus oryzae]
MTGTILVVDDKADNLYLLQALLTGHGFTVEAARHGAEALAMARQHLPILCITDLLMPVMDGYTLLRHWKADARLRDVPVMVYTATYTAPEDEQLAIAMGADAFQVKPTQPEALIAAVRAVLEQRIKPASAAAQAENPLLLHQYSATLVRKLEEKSIELEAANRSLREEADARQSLLATRDAILEALPAQVALIDHDGVIIAVNGFWDRFLDLHGRLNPKMMVGGNYLDSCHDLEQALPGTGNAVLAGVRSVLSGQQPQFEIEYAFPKPGDPRPLWIRAIATPILYQDRIGAVITRLDVTERRRIEEENRETAARLSLAVDSARMGIWELAEDGTLAWNQVMHDIYAVPADVAPTMALWPTLIDEADRPGIRAGMNAVIANGGRAERQFSIQSLDGIKRTILGVIRQLPSIDGAPPKLIGTHLDITDRIRQQQALQAVNSSMETLIAEAPIGILVLRDLKPLMANDALAYILGLPGKADVVALPNFERFFDDEQRIRMAAIIKALLADEPTPEMMVLKGQRADGRPVEIEARMFCLNWDDGPAVCMMVTDVTQQRAVEAQLRQTHRLEAVGQLTGGVAHDFNNLLTVILGNAELLEEGLSESPLQHRLAGMIVRAAERGAVLARQLLAFSRRQQLEPATVDINLLLAGMEDFLRQALGATNELMVQLAPDLWPATVDLAQLENALLNLVVNARDAMPEGGTVTITTRNFDQDDKRFNRPPDLPPGAHVMIAVSDTGEGMDEATRLHAFEPFFTTKDVGKGSGLGLSMVYGFVKQSHGAVQILSSPGHGTTVELWLPRAALAAKPTPEKTAATALPRGAEHLLVVEDDPMVQGQVVAQLELLGYRVTSASNGVEALELVRQGGHYDLLFTDIVMPGGLNGHGLVAEALALRPGLAVLLTSGFADRAERPAGVSERVFPMLRKPYRRDELAKMVRAAIDRQREPAVSA